MAQDVNKMYDWGILGCGWLGSAWGNRCQKGAKTAWGTARRPEALAQLKAMGIAPIAFDAQGQLLSTWPPCQHLLVALPPSAGTDAFKLAANMAEASKWTVLISSTSVYPDGDGPYNEGDAVRRISPHSGACLLDLETLFDPQTTTILRAGGLFGPGRHPGGFLRNRPLSKPTDPVNVVHLDDALGAIEHTSQNTLPGAFNLTAPELISRAEFYSAAGAISPPNESETRAQGRRILSNRITKHGYRFLHPNAARAASEMAKFTP